MDFQVKLHVTYSIRAGIDGLVLESVPEKGDDELWLGRSVLNQSSEGGLRSLCRNLLRKVRHPEKIGIEQVTERVQCGAKGDRELGVECACVRGDGRTKAQELIAR